MVSVVKLNSSKIFSFPEHKLEGCSRVHQVDQICNLTTGDRLHKNFHQAGIFRESFYTRQVGTEPVTYDGGKNLE